MASRIKPHMGQRHRAAALSTASLFVIALTLVQPAFAQSSSQGTQADTCAGDNTGITLSPGFCATVFADNIGHVRHMGSRPIARSTSTPGAAAIIIMTRHRRAAFWWRSRTRRAPAAPT